MKAQCPLTYIEEGVEYELNIVIDHGSGDNGYEICIVQNGRCVVGHRLCGWGIRVVNDLNGIVEDKIIRDDIIPDDQPRSGER
jgi:hypothetical protein